MIPAKVCYSGDVERAKQFRGVALTQVAPLLRHMEFRNLKTAMSIPFRPVDGIEIQVSSTHGLNVVNIHADSAGEIAAGKIRYATIDLRFFCAVGPAVPATVDDIRYYWVDFGAVSGLDQIRIYTPGRAISSTHYRDYVLETSALYLDPDFFEYVVTLPGDNDHSQTKAFSLTAAGVTQRMVAGYHFLSRQNRDNSRTMLLAEITPTTADGSGTTRLLYNVDGTICWARNLQDWWGIDVMLGDGTGEIAAYINNVQFNTSTGNFELISDTTTGFYIDGTTAILASSGDFTNDTAYEPMCLGADIVSVSRDSISVNLPARHTPALWTFSLDLAAASFTLLTHTEQSTMTRNEFSSAGFSSYTSAEYEYYSRMTPDSWDTGYVTTEHHESCVGMDFAACTEHAYPNYFWRRTVVRDTQSEVTKQHFTVTVSFPSHEYSYTKAVNYALNRYEYVEDAYSSCDWVFPPGQCQVQGGGSNYNWWSRTMVGSLNGEFGNQLFGSSPGNNINYVYQEIVDIDIASHTRQLVIGGYAGLRPKNLDSTLLWNPAIWSEFSSAWVQSPPLYATTPIPFGSTYSPWSVCRGAWPVGFDLDVYCGLPLSKYPGTFPALTESGGTWVSSGAINSSTTTTVGLYYVDGYQFNASDTSSIRYLDDRTAHDTHGLCIAVKGNNPGEWISVYHGGDGVTETVRDKYYELETALVASGALRSGEVIHDIGLI